MYESGVANKMPEVAGKGYVEKEDDV